jgi:hypothetical protein
LRCFAPIAFDLDFEPAPGVRIRLASSGHILGSSFVTLDTMALKERQHEEDLFRARRQVGKGCDLAAR